MRSIFILLWFTFNFQQMSSGENILDMTTITPGFLDCHVEFFDLSLVKEDGDMRSIFFPVVRRTLPHNVDLAYSRNPPSYALWAKERFRTTLAFETSNYWFSSKHNCKLILILNARTNEHVLSILSSYDFLENCEQFPEFCYSRYTYAISVINLRNREADFERVSKLFSKDFNGGKQLPMTMYQIIFTKSAKKISITIGRPCNSIVTVHAKDQFSITTRHFLDALHLEGLRVACNFEYSFVSHYLFTHSLRSYDVTYDARGKPNYIHTPIYILENVRLVLNKTRNFKEETTVRLVPRQNNRMDTYIRCDSERPLIKFCRASNGPILVYFMKELSYNFITCDRNLRKFKLYAEILDTGLWVAVLSVVVMLVIYKVLKRFCNYLLSSVLSFIIQMFGQKGSKLKLLFRGALVGSLISCGFVAISYKGKLTATLSSVQRINTIETVEDALVADYKILLPTTTDKESIRKSLIFKHDYSDERKRFRWLSAIYPELPSYPVIQTYDRRPQNLRDESSAAEMYEKIIQNLLWKPFDVLPRNYSYEKELGKCSKTILLGEKTDIEEMVLALNFSREKLGRLYAGKDKFMQKRRYWVFSPIQWDRFDLLYTQLQAFKHSGIILFLEKFHLFKSHLKIQTFVPKDVVKSLALSSQPMSVFDIYLLATLVCLVVLILEIVGKKLHFF